jgi:hypothetical protein
VFQHVRPHPEEATNGSRECAPDDRLRAVSKDGLKYRFVIPKVFARRRVANFEFGTTNSIQFAPLTFLKELV